MLAAAGIGGIIGAILRFMISGWFFSMGGISLAGTLCINLAGCMMLGFLQGLARTGRLPEWLVMGLGTGMIGAFTTFSTFSIEVVSLIVQGYLLLSIAYLLASSVGGYYFACFGFSLAYRKGVQR